MHTCMQRRRSLQRTQAGAHSAREGASVAGGRLNRRAQACRAACACRNYGPRALPPKAFFACRVQAMDASGLLALQQLPTGSQWAWAATRPSEAELRACGLPGSEWSSPAQPRARDVPQARNLLLLLHGLGGQLSRHVRPGASVGYVQATRISLPRCVCVPDAQGGLPAGPRDCTYWVRVPASAVSYVPRTVAPQATSRRASRRWVGRWRCPRRRPSRCARRCRSPPACLVRVRVRVRVRVS